MQTKKYDIIIVGAGPAGIFCALETIKKNPKKKILIIEKGRAIEKRICPKRKTSRCTKCNPCHITSGFAGAGAYSDGKLTFSPDIGGELKEYVKEEELLKLFSYADSTYISFGADNNTYGTSNKEAIEKIKTKAIQSNLKLIEDKIRHIGTEKCSEVYKKIQKHLIEQKVELLFNNQVKDLIIKNNQVKGVIADKEYYSDKVIVTVGREGAEWLSKICRKHQIKTETGVVDIGVRIEVRNEIMEEANNALYEPKLIYYTKTFDDKVRTFCQNPSGIVSTEHYDKLATVNGHSYKDKKYKTKNTNFAILVSNKFTKPFNNPIEYGQYIARLGNMLSGGNIIVQRFGDFKKGRRTTEERLRRNNITPTLKDATPGDLSLVLPYRIMLDIKEMMEALNNLFPGITSDETLMYGVEVKFYSNKLIVNKKFETNIKELYAGGDGAGITRGIIQASVNGILIARNISEK